MRNQLHHLRLRLTSPRGEVLPPLPMIRVSAVANFRTTGEDWASRIIAFGGLTESDRALEVGCGIGRVASALARRFPSLDYHGFDIKPEEVRWLRDNFTRKHPTFRFGHLNAHNAFYNPAGTLDPATAPFPYADDSFDFVYLTSVFTHMRPGEIAHYLREIRRVLAPGGRLFASWFLLDEEAREGIRAGLSSRPFRHEIEPGCFTDNLAVPEDAIAYAPAAVAQRYEDAGFEAPVWHRGRWYRDPVLNAARDYQDIALAVPVGVRAR